MGKISNVQVVRRYLVGLIGSIEAAQYRAAYLLSRAQEKDKTAERYLRKTLDGLEEAYKPSLSLFRYLGGAKYALEDTEEEEEQEE